MWPARFRQDALAAGGGDDRVSLRDGPGTHVAGQPNQRGRDGALLDAVPDAAGLALKRPAQLGDLHHGPAIAATAGLAFSSSRSSSKSQSPSISWSGSSWWRLLSLRSSPAYWAALLEIVGDAAAGSAAASGAEAAGGADAIAELAPLALAAL